MDFYANLQNVNYSDEFILFLLKYSFLFDLEFGIDKNEISLASGKCQQDL